ncbi:hypothetical protein [Streptomyces sp. NPDC047108]|uniref:hypothetical protein n=1 Tax=Streptomyces sp. NPDC047108 TaxID=3155025 RepID=UPI003403EE4A
MRRRRYPSIDRLSGSCTADLRRLERTRFSPGATEAAFWHWKSLAHGPLGELLNPFSGHCCGIPECCGTAFARTHLETVLHALPRKSSRELRALVRALDEKILTRARIIPAEHPETPWWRDFLVQR